MELDKMMKPNFGKNRYVMIVKHKKASTIRRVFYYNRDRIEILLDAYWALEFGGADRVTIRSTKNRKKIVFEIYNTKEFDEIWKHLYWPNANYFVFAFRR